MALLNLIPNDHTELGSTPDNLLLTIWSQYIFLHSQYYLYQELKSKNAKEHLMILKFWMQAFHEQTKLIHQKIGKTAMENFE